MTYDSREDIDLDWWGSEDEVDYEEDDSPPYPHDLDGHECPEFDG